MKQRSLIFIFFLIWSNASFSYVAALDLDNKSFFTFESIHYITPIDHDSQSDNDLRSDNYFNIWFNIKKSKKIKSFSLRGNILTRIPIINNSYVNFNIPELYASYSYAFKNNFLNLEFLDFTIGRKVLDWSYMDTYWNLDTWNSYNAWDAIYPTHNGLFGTFFDFKSKNFSLNLFFGGIYLPNSGVEFRHEEQQIYSTDRWFSDVPSHIKLSQDILLDIKYLLKEPFVYDVVFQDSYIASFETWIARKMEFWVKWNFGFKPVNSLFLVRNTDNLLKIGGGDSDDNKDTVVTQTITSFPLKHRIFSFESGMRYKNIYTLVSFVDNVFKKGSKLSDNWTPIIENNDYRSYLIVAGYEMEPFNNNLKQYLQGNLLYTELKNKNKSILFDINESGSSYFENHIITRGFGADVGIKFFSGDNIKFKFDMRYWNSFFNDGGLLTTSATYYFFKGSTYLSIMLNILGVEEDKYKSFLKKFETNDRFLLRLSHAF